jgi:hypothetical protein
LFAGFSWRVATSPFDPGAELAQELASLGRVLLQFNRAVNLLYRLSVAGRQPAWVAEWLDRGKPATLIDLQRAPAFKHDLPRVIRPDIILTDDGWCITELDAVPGGIGLTAWLNQTYAGAPTPGAPPLGGAEGMLQGFAGMFGDARRVHIVVSDEAATYRPEMVWLAAQLNARGAPATFQVQTAAFTEFGPGDAVYRFFELFDLPNVPAATAIFDAAGAHRLRVSPPPKPIFEEKMLFALLWNRNLRGFWRQELGASFYERLLQRVPQTWVVDPAPLPPQAAIPDLNLTDWRQLGTLSQRERDLILKVSGFHEQAWGARGVALGSDLAREDWATAVDRALRSFPQSPYVLQRYRKPRAVAANWFDFGANAVHHFQGRVRLCPYYFVHGDGDAARAHLGGVLATTCPADKKILHGMSDAILAPVAHYCVSNGGL